MLKGTVRVISSDPACKDGIARFTTEPLKALFDQVNIKYPCVCFLKRFIYICDCSVKVTCEFLAYSGEIHKQKHTFIFIIVVFLF